MQKRNTYNTSKKYTSKKASGTGKYKKENQSVKSNNYRPVLNKRGDIKNVGTQDASKKQFMAIIWFTMGLLCLALDFIQGIGFWKALHNLIFGLFGIGSYFIPAIFIYLSFIYSTDKPLVNYKNIFLKVLGIFILTCTLLQILKGSNFNDQESVIQNIVNSFNDGIDKNGGGIFSVILVWPLLKVIGFGGALVIVILLLFVLVMATTGATLKDLFTPVSTTVKKLENNYIEKQNNNPKFNINVPLDEDNMPIHPVQSPKLKNDEKLKDKLNKNERIPESESFNSIGVVELNEFCIKPKSIKNRNETVRYPQEFNIENLVGSEGDSRPSLKQEKISEELPEILTDNNVIDEQISNLSLDSSGLPEEFPIFGNGGSLSEGEEGNDIVGNKEKQEYINSLLSSKEDIAGNDIAGKDVKYSISVKDITEGNVYNYPPVNLLKESVQTSKEDQSDEIKLTAQKLVDTLKSFGVQTSILGASRGPAVTRYELQPSAGVKISKITGLADDIALNLATAGVRIEAPIPNKAAVGIEVPNKIVSMVNIRELIDSPEFKNSKGNLSIVLGKDIAGNITIGDIAKMPHVLIAGSTGSGKSVCINSIVTSLIYKSSPEQVRLLMIDPKVVELGCYNGIPHLLIPVVTDPKKAAGALNWAVSEMLNRYRLFAETGVRDLNSYNKLATNSEELNTMPQIVIIIDELADLMMAAPNEVEDSICRLAQMARAAGMHLVIATQRPSVDVITGIIKANIPSRIAFAVSSQVDSRTIIDSAGAEKLLGRGDMLFYPIGYTKPVRVQGCFVSDKEVERVVNFIKQSREVIYDEEIQQEIERRAVAEKGKNSQSLGGNISDEEDVMIPKAIECAIQLGEISTSLLQRKLKLGYARAARIIDEMEQRGIVSAKDGSKPRQILISRQQWIEMNLNK